MARESSPLGPAAACGRGSEEATPGPMCPTFVQEKGAAVAGQGPYLSGRGSGCT